MGKIIVYKKIGRMSTALVHFENSDKGEQLAKQLVSFLNKSETYMHEIEYGATFYYDFEE